MISFFETYKNQLIYALIIIAGVFLLRFLTSLLHKWFLKLQEKKLSGIRPSAIHVLKRVLNTIWLVLGIILISFLSFGSSYEHFESNFRITAYVGFLSVLTIVIASSLNFGFRKGVDKKMATGEDPTFLKFSRYVAVSVVYIVGVMFILLAFPSLKGVAQTALGGAGIIALIAGVASQEALANLVGGVFIIAFKPFKIGDIIKTSDNSVGTVVDITLRHTVLKTAENKMLVIPNAVINKEKIINYNLKDTRICERINFGISYDSDIDLAKKIIREECENHPLILDNRSAVEVLDGKPVVKVVLTSLDESSMNLRASAWARTNSQANELHFDVLESIKKRFDREGIEIPYPHVTLTSKTPKTSKTSKASKIKTAPDAEE